MGCICSKDCSIAYGSSFALKFPHGKEGIEYSDDFSGFIPVRDISKWIDSLYKKEWKHWILYNDDMDDSKNTKGHCKGILAWNNECISWMCHSVPRFPKMFGNFEIDEGELIYGQSFYHILLPYHNDTLISIVQQLYIMEASMYCKHTDLYFPQKKNENINTIVLNDSVSHIAKSPHCHIDIYDDCIAERYKFKWRVETWKRGHEIVKETNMKDISLLQYEKREYSEKQDHSKWCVSDDEYFLVGDLNRMTTQFKRGGGGFLCKNKNIAEALRSLIKQ